MMIENTCRALLTSVLFSAALAFGSPLLAQTVGTYEVVEIEMTATGSYPNPYLQMAADDTTPGLVTLTATGPNGEEIEIDGFWDGGDTWRARFAPTAPGTWTYVTSSSDAGLDNQTGSVEVVESDSHGFVEVDPDHPHYFRWSDGTPFFYAANTLHIAHFSSANRRVDDGTFAEEAAARQAQGFTAVFWGYRGFNKPKFRDRTQANEGGPPFVDYDPDRLNPAYYQYGDQRMEIILDHGLLPMFTLGWPDQGICNMGQARLKRYWRYLIARYAAYNTTWNLFGEGAEWGVGTSNCPGDNVTGMRTFGALTKRWDPYDHPTTVHTPPAGCLDDDWMDFISLQTWEPGQETTHLTANYLGHNKPVVNVEYGGYENTDQVATTADLRNRVWDIVMHGGFYDYEIWANDLTAPGAMACSHLNWFFRDRVSFWRLAHSPGLFGGRPGLADPGREYVIYLPSGGSVTVDLSAVTSELQLTWYNPRDGQYQPTTAVDPASPTFTAPSADSWVLHIHEPPPPLVPAAPPWLRAE